MLGAGVYSVIMLLGIVATLVITVALWKQRRPGSRIWPGFVIGLVAMLLWPVTLWVAIGLWWHRQWKLTPHLSQATVQIPPTYPAQPLQQKSSRRTISIIAVCTAASIITLAIVGATAPPPGKTTQAQPEDSQVVLTSPPTPLPLEAKVLETVDGATVKIQIAGQAARMVRLAGVESPTLGVEPQCWGAEAKTFADQTLVGQSVRVMLDPGAADAPGGQVAELILPDGTNYSILAVEQGAARMSPDARTPLISEFVRAQSAAGAAQRGLWGAPCFGSLQIAPPRPPELTPVPAPSSEAEMPTEVPPTAVYYPNCAAARAAGAAPLYRGQPGYRPQLDRDGDGIACEK